MKKKSIAAILVCTLMISTGLAAVSLLAYAVNINYVNNAPDIAQTPIFGQMIDPSGYYNTDFGDTKTAGNALDNRRVWIWDYSYIQGQPDNPFMMMKWDMGFATNFIRIYPDIENGFQADGHDYLEWSLWGSSNLGENTASWTLLWDPIASAGNNVNNLVVTQVAGTAVSALIYRQTNPGVGTVPAPGFGDAFTIDLVLPQSYQFFGIRASTKDTASWDPDPEINAIATFLQYYLTVQTDPSGLTPAPTPPSGWFAISSVVDVTAYDVTGYVFVYWDVDGISQGVGVNPITVHMDADHTATAHYWPELECETFVTDSNFNPIDGFDTVWTPKDMRKTVFKLASTNPGQFMWVIRVHNTWPIPIDTLTMAYNLDDDFILKGADPIQVHTGYGKTGTRIDATVVYGDTGTITISNIAHSTTLYITLHMEYAPARDYFDKATMLDWKALHEPNVFMCDYTATAGTVTGTGSCSTTLPDPLVILAVEE